MQLAYEYNITFDKQDFEKTPLPQGEYEQCVFTNCNFANGNISSYKFIDCSFWGCNMSMIITTDTVFNNIVFNDCKLLGAKFDACSQFVLSCNFTNCKLDHASFFKVKMKQWVFLNCDCIGVDFVESNLESAIFDHCNLSEAVFDHTILEKSDFRTAYNYSIDPEANKIRKARFSAQGIHGLLHKFDIIIS